MTETVRLLGDAEVRSILKIEENRLGDLVLVSRLQAGPQQLGYNAKKAKSYLNEYCEKGNDCSSEELSADCTHFVSHALNRGGVFVKLPSVHCDSALCTNARELAVSFSNARDKYNNVSIVNKTEEAREGDFIFCPIWFGLDYYHAMVLASRIEGGKYKVWSHTRNHCVREPRDYPTDIVIYRITATE